MTLWVFGYGSLIWNPGFDPAESRAATLAGWRRSFCMWSVHYRGTASRPGLVLALDRAERGQCRGVALRVRAAEEEPVLAALRARELISDAYLETTCTLALDDGRQVTALTYVIDRAHRQYCAGLSPQEQAAIIAAARGEMGTNEDYLQRTVDRLAGLGLADPELAALAEQVHALKAAPAQRGAAGRQGRF